MPEKPTKYKRLIALLLCPHGTGLGLFIILSLVAMSLTASRPTQSGTPDAKPTNPPPTATRPADPTCAASGVAGLSPWVAVCVQSGLLLVTIAAIGVQRRSNKTANDTQKGILDETKARAKAAQASADEALATATEANRIQQEAVSQMGEANTIRESTLDETKAQAKAAKASADEAVAAANKANEIHEEALGEMRNKREYDERKDKANLQAMVVELTDNNRLLQGSHCKLRDGSYKAMGAVIMAGAEPTTQTAIQKAYSTISESNDTLSNMDRSQSLRPPAWQAARSAVNDACQKLASDPAFPDTHPEQENDEAKTAY